MRIAIDTGGTFTDCVYHSDGELRVLKLLSTPANPAEAILSALRQIGLTGGTVPRHRAKNEVRHGTTVATNTLLERTGARVAFVTTAGFEDMIAIGRQARPNLYDWFATPEPPLVPQELRFGIAERTTPDGSVLQEVVPADLQRLVDSVRDSRAEAVAVSLLFAFANPHNEALVSHALGALRLPISVSHKILPEFREYERSSTIVINAYLAPKVGRYLHDLEQKMRSSCGGARLSVMQSSGGIMAATEAAREPVRTVLSGPAGGVIGAKAVARLSGFERVISFDMGGTSTDVALVEKEPGITNESVVAGLPVAVPMLDIHTVGAGGGSIARFDSTGALKVGPQSAGADPGPICYGTGTQPTVTDANLVLGRMDPELFLGGTMKIDEDRARDFLARARGRLSSVEEFASGVVQLAEAAMERAIRLISVERGHDPRDFTLVSFGGAGGLHACALAQSLRIPRVLVPRLPGALSALGILMSDVIKEFSRTVMAPPDSPELPRHLRQLEQQGRQAMRAERLQALAQRSFDVRYTGQGYELNVPATPGFVRQFHAAHRQRYGHADPKRPVEVVNVRVRMIARSEKVSIPKSAVRRGDARQAIVRRRSVWFGGRSWQAPVYHRSLLHAGDAFKGPAIVAEYSATTLLPPRCRARVDRWENIILEVPHG